MRMTRFLVKTEKSKLTKHRSYKSGKLKHETCLGTAGKTNKISVQVNRKDDEPCVIFFFQEDFFFIYKQTWDIWIEWMLYVCTGALSERKLVFDFILIFMSRMSALFWLKWKRAKRSGIKSSSQNFNDFIFFTDWKEAVPASSLLPESKSHPLSNFFIWCHTCYKHRCHFSCSWIVFWEWRLQFDRLEKSYQANLPQNLKT